MNAAAMARPVIAPGKRKRPSATRLQWGDEHEALVLVDEGEGGGRRAPAQDGAVTTTKGTEAHGARDVSNDENENENTNANVRKPSPPRVVTRTETTKPEPPAPPPPQKNASVGDWVDDYVALRVPPAAAGTTTTATPRRRASRPSLLRDFVKRAKKSSASGASRADERRAARPAEKPPKWAVVLGVPLSEAEAESVRAQVHALALARGATRAEADALRARIVTAAKLASGECRRASAPQHLGLALGLA